MNKLEFLRLRYPEILAQLDEATPPLFGKMNVRQMIEHMAQAFTQASGKVIHPNTQPEAVTAKMYQFMMSDKPFRDNTPNPNLPETPPPPAFADKASAIKALQEEIDYFVSVFEDQPEKRIENPFFGNLNRDEWIHLLHKHALHHLRQFNSLPSHESYS